MQEAGKRSRRTILAERGAQLGLVLWILLHLLIYTVLTLAVVLGPSALRLTQEGLPLEERFLASREFLLLDARVVPVVLAMVAVGTLHFLFLTHRIFGPLARLKGVLRRWRETGVWPSPLHVRRRDYHEQLFEEFNRSALALGEDVAGARELIRRAAERARSLPAAPGCDPAGAEAVAEDCRQALERLDRWRK